VGVVLSAQHGNEANYVLAKLARELWQAGRIYVSGRPAAPERADEVLRDADVSPNRRGVANILGGSQAGGPEELAADLGAGRLRALVVLGHDLPIGDEALAAAAKLDGLVVVSDREVGVAARAQVALPCAAWAEAHGTITNRQGRVQRLRAAYAPGGQSLPAWEALVRLGRASGAALAYPHAKAVFQEMVAQVQGFAGAEWGREAALVQLRFAGSRG
jgi:predicted molibdopterin-dependent oxidoreductase YjgC